MAITAYRRKPNRAMTQITVSWGTAGSSTIHPSSWGFLRSTRRRMPKWCVKVDGRRLPPTSADCNAVGGDVQRFQSHSVATRGQIPQPRHQRSSGDYVYSPRHVPLSCGGRSAWRRAVRPPQIESLRVAFEELSRSGSRLLIWPTPVPSRAR